MATTNHDIDERTRAIVSSAVEEANVELEYHALMGVQGGDEPTHVRAFDRDVFGPPTRAAHQLRGELSGEHRAIL
jgi:hypothetical protein